MLPRRKHRVWAWALFLLGLGAMAPRAVHGQAAPAPQAAPERRFTVTGQLSRVRLFADEAAASPSSWVLTARVGYAIDRFATVEALLSRTLRDTPTLNYLAVVTRFTVLPPPRVVDPFIALGVSMVHIAIDESAPPGAYHDEVMMTGLVSVGADYRAGPLVLGADVRWYAGRPLDAGGLMWGAGAGFAF